MKTGLYSSKQFRYLSLTLLLINKCPLSIPQTTGGRQTCVILIKGKNMHHGKNELFSYTLSRKHQLIQKQKFSNFPGQQRQLKTTISIRQGLFIILGTNSTFEPTTLDKTLGILTQQLVKMTRHFAPGAPPPPPPLSQCLDDHPPPPYLMVWIRHRSLQCLEADSCIL